MSELTVRFDLSFGSRSLRCLMASAMIFSAVTEVASESVTLTTYYPAPSGVYSQMITTGNTWLSRDGGGVEIGTAAVPPVGGLGFGAANPTISAPSYIVIPNGLYVNVGTAYFQTQIQTRGGVHNDSAATLQLQGGTAGTTEATGTLQADANLTVGTYISANAYQPNYAGWAAYGTGAGGAAIYNDNGGFQTLMLVGNNSAGGATRHVSVWDELVVNGQVVPTDANCQEEQYNVDGFTSCTVVYGPNSYATLTSGVIADLTMMPLFMQPPGGVCPL